MSSMANAELTTRYQRFFQYFWDPEPRNDDSTRQTIWCLGRSYPDTTIPTDTKGEPTAASDPPLRSQDELPLDAQGQTGSNSTAENVSESSWPADFLDDFEARIWLTYRNDFPAIARSTSASLTFAVRLRNIGDNVGFTSDTGWGCMIRSGQCVLSNALSILWLGREWRRKQSPREERRILALFADDPRAPFSVHKFVEHGAAACGVHPGEWFGPSATAQCIEALVRGHKQAGLKVYIAAEGAQVYENTVLKLAQSESSFSPLLILAGVRLGIDRVTPVYRQALLAMIKMKQAVGIAGGRPSASHYFIATQGEDFFYLDPHHPRPALPWHNDPEQYTEEEVNSCHTRRLRRLNVDKMDPSMLLAFIVKDRADWDNWTSSIRALPGAAILHLAKGEPPGDSVIERDDALDEVEALDDDDDDDMNGEHELPSKTELFKS